MQTFQYKSLFNDGGVFTIVKFYRSPNLGECHVDYLKVAAHCEAKAIEIARQAL